MTDTKWIDPETILAEGVQSGLEAYERTNNIQASAQAVSEVISERFGFPSVFAILANKMTLKWWLLELGKDVTVESILNNVLTGIIAQQLAEELGLDIGDTPEENSCQSTKQKRKLPPTRPSKPPPLSGSSPQMKKLSKPKPVK